MDKAIWAVFGGILIAVIQGFWAFLSSKRTSQVDHDKVIMEERKALSAEATIIRDELRQEIQQLNDKLKESTDKAEKCMTDFYTLRDEHVKFKEEYSLMKIENNNTKVEYLKMAKRLSDLQKEHNTLKGKVGKLENGSVE